MLLRAFAAIAFGVLTVFAASEPTSSDLSKESLDGLLAEIKPWNTLSTNYPRRSWENLMKAASFIQRCNPNSVEAAINAFQNEKHHSNGQDSKLFLLMRVIFALPEHAFTTNQVFFNGWVTGRSDSKSNANSDGSVNVSWPISWKDGIPHLVSGFQGKHGPPYDAAIEYRYFREKYPARDLGQQQQSTNRTSREFWWQRNGLIILTEQTEREAKLFLAIKEPKLDWKLLKNTTLLFSTDAKDRPLTVRFEFNGHDNSFGVFFNDRGEVAGYERIFTFFPNRFPRATDEKVYPGADALK